MRDEENLSVFLLLEHLLPHVVLYPVDETPVVPVVHYVLYPETFELFWSEVTVCGVVQFLQCRYPSGTVELDRRRRHLADGVLTESESVGVQVVLEQFDGELVDVQFVWIMFVILDGHGTFHVHQFVPSVTHLLGYLLREDASEPELYSRYPVGVLRGNGEQLHEELVFGEHPFVFSDAVSGLGVAE